jgi:hypothetical protein
LAGLRYDCQGSSATVTNPGLNPADTNAKLLTYHQIVNPVNTTPHRWPNFRRKTDAIARDPVHRTSAAASRRCETKN